MALSGTLARISSAVVLLASGGPALAQPPACEVLEKVSFRASGLTQGGSLSPSMSADGRFVAFESGDGDLHPDDTNLTSDVFVHDRATGLTELVSVDTNESQGPSGSHSPSISADGRFVAFMSLNALHDNDSNNTADVFVRDREQGSTDLVSVDPSGNQGNSPSHSPSINADGRFVAFVSLNQFDISPPNIFEDVFVRDREMSKTTRVSVVSGGGASNGGSTSPSISADGSHVAFTSQATNLAPGAAQAASVFVHVAGQTELVSVRTDGTSTGFASGEASISADGRYVAFSSVGTLAGPGNVVRDVFLRDRAAGTTVLVSSEGPATAAAQAPSISADGRFVAFTTSRAIEGDFNGKEDIYILDLAEGVIERASEAGGVEGNGGSTEPSLSADGRFVAFVSQATNFAPPDSINADVFAGDNCLASGCTLAVESAAQVDVFEPGSTHDVTWSGVPPSGFDVQLQLGLLGGSGPRTLAASTPNTGSFTWTVPQDLLPSADYTLEVRGLGPDAQCAAASTGVLAIPSGAEAPEILWVKPPVGPVQGGEDEVPLEWLLVQFTPGSITENQAFFGITSPLGASPVLPEVGEAQNETVYSATFTAPNIGTFDEPELYGYIIRALDAGTQILSSQIDIQVDAGPNPPTVTWVTEPPLQAESGSQFTVSWQVTNFQADPDHNAVVWGITHVLDQTPDLPGGNGTYTTVVQVPDVVQQGVLSYTAVAENDIELAFAEIKDVFITLP